MTDMTYFLRFIKRNKIVRGEILDKEFRNTKLIKHAILSKYIFYNKFKDGYELTSKGNKLVEMFDRH